MYPLHLVFPQAQRKIWSFKMGPIRPKSDMEEPLTPQLISVLPRPAKGQH